MPCVGMGRRPQIQTVGERSGLEDGTGHTSACGVRWRDHQGECCALSIQTRDASEAGSREDGRSLYAASPLAEQIRRVDQTISSRNRATLTNEMTRSGERTEGASEQETDVKVVVPEDAELGRERATTTDSAGRTDTVGLRHSCQPTAVNPSGLGTALSSMMDGRSGDSGSPLSVAWSVLGRYGLETTA